MGKNPAFQLYASDFDMDTATWENDEIGAYLRLLIYEWVNGGLPEDTYKLSKIVRESERKFREKWKNLSHKFHLNGNGLLVNLRMEEERDKQRQYIESQSEKGIKSAKKRWGDRVTPVITTVTERLQPKDNLSISSSISSSTSKDKKNIKHIAKPQKPASPDVKLFIDFYHSSFKERFNTTPVIQGAKDGSIVKGLLNSISLEELKSLLLSMFDSDDPFIHRSGYTLGVFQSQINKLKIGPVSENKSFSGLRAWAEEIKEEQHEARK